MSNKMFRPMLLVIVLLLMITTAYGSPKVDITGQVRVRHETSQNKSKFETDATTMDFTGMRTRVMIDALIKGNTHAVVQFQDTRTFGANNMAGKSASGTLNDSKNVDVHQAYLQIDRLFADGWGAKAGRFEVNLGGQRVFGGVGWSNVGRSWEGLQLWYDLAKVKVTAYALKHLEFNDPLGNRDYDIIGANAIIKSCGTNIFVFHEYDANNKFEVGDTNNLDRTNIGVYHKRQFDQIDVEFNGVYQFGSQLDKVGEDILEMDIAAFLASVEVGYTLEGKAKPRIAIGVDFTSGDDNATDNKHKAYNNLYYTGHKFRGYMDYFVKSPNHGLIDLMLRGKASPAPGWVVKGDLHYFKAAADYEYLAPSELTVHPPDSIMRKSSDIGIELDLTVSTKKVAGVGLTGGFSVFFAEESWAGIKDPDPGWWGYLMATANF